MIVYIILCDSFHNTCCIFSAQIVSPLSQVYKHTNSIYEYMNSLKFIHKCFLRQRQLNFLVVWAVGRIILGWSVGIIIIIILSFRVGIFKNKYFDHQIKETCAIMSTQVTYEIDHVSLLKDSTISSALNFCFLCILL